MATGLLAWCDDDELDGTALLPLTFDLFVELFDRMEVLLEEGLTKRICFFKTLEASTHLCV